ncbi:MAG: diguanylate cyclase [Rhizobacter sp.]|nr:diguanylate cyclase [Rhizobacter sp.]
MSNGGWDVGADDATSLKSQLELLGRCIAHLNDAVLITEGHPVDEPGPRILFANAAFTRMTGYTLEEVVGRSPRLLQGPKTSRSELRRIREALGRWEEVRVELVNYRKDGNEFYVEMDIVPISDRDGHYTHWVAVQRDVTARKRAEAVAALREAQRVESLGTLASGIAHDFNNVLAAILGNVAIAQAELGDNPPVGASLAQINKAGLRARGLIQRILSYSRRQPESFTYQPLGPIVLEACELVRSTMPAGTTLDMSLPDTPLQVLADASQLHQVLLNLGTNAWHALKPGGGRIVVTLEAVEFPAAARRGERGKPSQNAATDGLSGRHVVIQVTDDGIGMDEATVARVFEPYFTTRQFGQGTGLGLSVVWGIVAAHRGRITVDSQPGGGTTFRVFLPLTDAVQEDPPASPVPSAPTQARGEHVLVLDDDDVVGLTMEALLQRAGYRVSLFNDPVDAIAEVRRSPQSFDAVVTDFNMPVLSGVDVTRAIRQIRADLPVLLGSGHVSEAVVTAALEAGVARVFNKEFAVERLSTLLAQVLAAARRT